jgi:hypothetical protein
LTARSVRFVIVIELVPSAYIIVIVWPVPDADTWASWNSKPSGRDGSGTDAATDSTSFDRVRYWSKLPLAPSTIVAVDGGSNSKVPVSIRSSKETLV